MTDELCSFLDWDSKHFFYRIGKINKQKLKKDDFIKIENWTKDNKIECIYYLKENNDDRSNLELSYGYRHVDTRANLSLNITKLKPFNIMSRNLKVEILKSFSDDIYNILDNSISNTRFYNDKNFKREHVRYLYQRWIRASYDSKSSKVMIAKKNSKIIGFISSKSINNSEASIELAAVDIKYNHQGVGSNILSRCINFWKLKGKKNLFVSTQHENKPAISFYQKFGFKVLSIRKWYHKWNFEK